MSDSFQKCMYNKLFVYFVDNKQSSDMKATKKIINLLLYTSGGYTGYYLFLHNHKDNEHRYNGNR